MRKSMAVALMMAGVALSASAQASQAKFSAKLSCGKPDVNAMADVPDAPGHMVMLAKQNCTWPTPFEVAGSKSVSAVDVGVSEARNGAGTGHGYSTATMDNGDKINVTYQGTMQMKQDGSGTFSGTWKFVGGTGAMKGIKGSGTYKGSAAADGTSSGDIEGHYTLPSGGKKKTK